MNQFPNQCRRRISGIQCQRTHIKKHYFCAECIEEVEKAQTHKKRRCNTEYLLDGERTFCRNEALPDMRKCSDCIIRAENKKRFFPHRLNKDLILDLKA